MRVVLFLAVLGVVAKGIPLNPKNPAETPFEYVAGHFGQILFGVVIWAASITSVIGAAYTSVSSSRAFVRQLNEIETIGLLGL